MPPPVVRLLRDWALELGIQVPALLAALPLAALALKRVDYGRAGWILPRCLGVGVAVAALLVLLRGLAPMMAYGQTGILITFAMAWLSIRAFFALESYPSMVLAAIHTLIALLGELIVYVWLGL